MNHDRLPYYQPSSNGPTSIVEYGYPAVGLYVLFLPLLHSTREVKQTVAEISSSPLSTFQHGVAIHTTGPSAERRKYHLTIYLLQDYYLIACKNV